MAMALPFGGAHGGAVRVGVRVVVVIIILILILFLIFILVFVLILRNASLALGRRPSAARFYLFRGTLARSFRRPASTFFFRFICAMRRSPSVQEESGLSLSELSW